MTRGGENVSGGDVLALLMEGGYILQDVIDIIKVIAGLLLCGIRRWYYD
jgi:hypothetical protein